MLPINSEEIIPLLVSSYGGDRPVFPFLFIMYFLILFAIFRYISEWIVWQKKYKFPIVKQLVGMWQQCGLLQFACRAIGVECGIFPVWRNNESGTQTVTDSLTWIFTDLMSYCRTPCVSMVMPYNKPWKGNWAKLCPFRAYIGERNAWNVGRRPTL